MEKNKSDLEFCLLFDAHACVCIRELESFKSVKAILPFISFFFFLFSF